MNKFIKVFVGAVMGVSLLAGVGTGGNEVEAAVTVPDRTVSVTDFGAVPNDNQLDTTAIQSALNSISQQGGGTVTVPAGTFEVSVGGGTALSMHSNIHLKLDNDAVIKMRPTDRGIHRMILLSNGDNNVKISGGTLVGDKHSHLGTTGEWGHGIHLYGGATNVEIRDITVREFWGDGVELENANYDVPDGVLVENIVADDNRRQGMSIVAGKNITVYNSTFKNTGGTPPAAGLDVEKDPPYDKVLENVVINHNLFEGNEGAGLEFVYSDSPTVSARYNVMRNNRKQGVYFGRSTGVTLEDNYIEGSGASIDQKIEYGSGIFMNYSSNNKVLGNVVSGSYRHGIQLLNGVNDNVVSGNKIVDNVQYGVHVYGAQNLILTDNHISGNGNNAIAFGNSTGTRTNNGADVAYEEPAEPVGLVSTTEPTPTEPTPTEPTPEPEPEQPSDLEQENEALKAENTQLKEENAALTNENAALKDDNAAKQAEIDRLQTKFERVRGVFNSFVQAMTDALKQP